MGGFQTLKATQASFTWTQLLSTVLLHCWWGLCARIWVGGFEETWQQLQYRPEGKKMQRWQLRVYVCFCAGLCMSASMQMKLVEDGRNINALPARPWGFGEEKRGRQTQGEGRNERKVEMLPGGPPHSGYYIRGGGGRRGRGEHSSWDQSSRGKEKKKKKRYPRAFLCWNSPLKVWCSALFLSTETKPTGCGHAGSEHLETKAVI